MEVNRTAKRHLPRLVTLGMPGDTQSFSTNHCPRNVTLGASGQRHQSQVRQRSDPVRSDEGTGADCLKPSTVLCPTHMRPAWLLGFVKVSFALSSKSLAQLMVKLPALGLRITHFIVPEQ